MQICRFKQKKKEKILKQFIKQKNFSLSCYIFHLNLKGHDEMFGEIVRG